MNYVDGIDIAELLVKKVLENISPEEEERLQHWIESSAGESGGIRGFCVRKKFRGA